MRKFALIAIAAVVAAAGTASTGSAALSDREGTIWNVKSDTQVAARDGQREARDDGGRGRDANRGKKGDPVWRIRGGKHGVFFLFRRDRSQDCFVRKTQVPGASGDLTVKTVRMCR